MLRPAMLPRTTTTTGSSSRLLLPLRIIMAIECCCTVAASSSVLLLVDDEDVIYRPQTERVLFPMQRSTGEAGMHGVMTVTLPWESGVAYNSVHYAGPAERAATGSPAFTLWYQCCPPGTGGQKPVHGQKKSTDGGCVVCLAHSSDGIAWVKPRLGMYAAIDGNGNVVAPANQTNIVLPSPPEQDGVPGWQQTHYGAGVVVDPWPASSDRRFKMVYWAVQGGYGVRRKTDPYGIYVAFSPNGLNWTRWSTEEPAIVGQSQSSGIDSPYSDEVADGTLTHCSAATMLSCHLVAKGTEVVYGLYNMHLTGSAN